MNKPQNRSRKIFNDILIYGIGSLGSKMLTFLLLPIYTFYIQPSEFGYYDLSLNAIFLLMPFLTLQLREGVFRFLIDNNDNDLRVSIISDTYKLLALTAIIGVFLGLILHQIVHIRHFWWIVGTLYTLSWYEVQVQIVRGLKRTNLFVGISILSSFLIALFSYLFVILLKWEIEGIYIAYILARFISLIVIEAYLSIFKNYFRINRQTKFFRKELLAYSLPLLPNVLCWWIISSSAVFFIKYFLGLEMNGQYGIAAKFSTIIMVLSGIFYQAWQETAITQFDKPDRDIFFSKMLNIYFGFMVFLCLGCSFLLKLLYGFIVQVEYQQSESLLFPLCIAVAFYALAVFLDLIYQCTKHTYKLLPSIIIAAFVNLIFNWVGVLLCGIWGILFSGIFTWVFLFCYRIIDIRKYMSLTLNKQFYFCLIQIGLGAFCYYLIDNSLLLVLAFVILCFTTGFLYKDELRLFYNQILKNKIIKIFG